MIVKERDQQRILLFNDKIVLAEDLIATKRGRS